MKRVFTARALGLGAVLAGGLLILLPAQTAPAYGARLVDGLAIPERAASRDEDLRFDELMQEAQLIFSDAIITDKSADTLEAAFYFNLLFEAMADIEQLPLLDEIQRLEFNRFLNATIIYYENDSQTLEKVETTLSVSVLRDELARYTRSSPADLGNMRVEYGEEGQLPITYNNRVGSIIHFFQTQGRSAMQVWLNRLPRYRPIFEPILEEEGVPKELIFHAMVESGLNPRAYSWAHAAGPWQFISSTARIYGLQRDWWRDERLDYEKATHASARYMKTLYDEFGDWYLALAAYNTGESRVRRAIKTYGTRDYWKLRLPKETRNHIPKIMAAFLIAQDPGKYGFTVTPEPPLEWDVVAVDKSLSFAVLGRIAECSSDTLKIFNPELRQNATPPPEDGKPYSLRIPRGRQEVFAQNYAAIAATVEPVLAGPRIIRHRVKWGESLYTISRKYGVGYVWLAEVNGLKNHNSIRPGQVLEIPQYPSGVASRVTPGNPNLKKIFYTVRPGDTLSEIAEGYQVGLSSVRRWNGIRSGREANLQAGHKLTLWVPRKFAVKDATPRLSVATAPLGMAKKVYTVRRGDTLSEIAETNNIGLSKLLSWNGLTISSHIRAGQRLVIFVPEG